MNKKVNVIDEAVEKLISTYNENGHEVPDPTPVAMPAGFQRPPSIRDLLRAMVSTELSRQAEAEGYESFEEADDFNVGDDPEIMRSDYELDADQERGSVGDFIEEHVRARELDPAVGASPASSTAASGSEKITSKTPPAVPSPAVPPTADGKPQ